MKRLPPLAVLLLLPVLAHAAPLTWDDCVKETVKDNPELKAARETVHAARYNRNGSYGKFLPSVSAGASAGRSGDEGSLGGALNDTDASKSSSLNLSAQMNLFNGLKDKSSLDAAQASLDSAEASFQQTRAQVSRDLQVAFSGLLYAQKQVALLDTIAKRQHENEGMVELHFQGGQENKGSYLNSQASSAQADAELLQGRRALRLAQRKLDRVLGRSLLDAPEVDGTLETGAPGDGDPDFKALALLSPAAKIAEAQWKIARCQVGSAFGQFLPTLSANGSMGRSGSDWPPKNAGWSAGLSLNYSLFSGGQDTFNLLAARSRRAGAEIDYKATLEDTAVSLENSYWNLLNALAQRGVQSKFLDASRVREEIAQAQYANGLLSYQDWDLVENDLINREKGDLSAQLAAKNAEADWILSQGKDELP